MFLMLFLKCASVEWLNGRVVVESPTWALPYQEEEELFYSPEISENFFLSQDSKLDIPKCTPLWVVALASSHLAVVLNYFTKQSLCTVWSQVHGNVSITQVTFI